MKEGKVTIHAVELCFGTGMQCPDGYVALVTFDARNAFNTVTWSTVEARMREKIG